MKLTINEKGVFLDGVEIPQCLAVDIKNLKQASHAEVVLHVAVSEVDIQFKPHGIN